ncbi:MAG TPA: helix-turn-helix domain-containing protein [Solirubrobacteraceae bacterium]|jgi:DNA-binding MarR family transcriptional regulator|nr:helix-turn-helix domain-containing protein [Solirubrobacteraceae bacterium]
MPAPDEIAAVVARSIHSTSYSTSLIRAMLIFAALPNDGRDRELAEMAVDLGVPQSTVHRYLRTFVELGMATQDEASRRYARIIRTPGGNSVQ